MTATSFEEKVIAMALAAPPATVTLEPGPRFESSTPKAAIRRCCAAWQRAYNAELKQLQEEFPDEDDVYSNEHDSAEAGGTAYRNAMPMLAGYEGIRDFIACAAHGILIGAIPGEMSSRLLYAAQVALSVQSHAPMPPRKCSE